MVELIQAPGALGASILSIALIGPDEPRRKEVASALSGCPGVLIREFTSFPADLDDLPQMLEQRHDVVIIDLDSDQEYALDVAEYLCEDGSTTVMVYSAQADKELVVRSMRAGAREFLALPLSAAEMADALARASVRRPGARAARRRTGRLCVFLGTKGGCGVTTIASKFAVELAQESGQKTLLIDLGLPLGDAALNLGIVSEYSTDKAFEDYNRLDASFLSSLLTTHSSGLFLLAAPGEFPQTQPTIDAIDKLVTVARQNFDHVVVDAGSRLDLRGSALFDASATIYLVTQVGVSELRNSNRLISQLFANRGRRLQIVLNRFTPNALLFDERHITKALTRPVDWKIPNDVATARQTQSTTAPHAQKDSPILIAIRQMARKACGLPEIQEKKRSFGLFLKELWPLPKALRQTAQSGKA